jgi:hypothetical protein
MATSDQREDIAGVISARATALCVALWRALGEQLARLCAVVRFLFQVLANNTAFGGLFMPSATRDEDRPIQHVRDPARWVALEERFDLVCIN